MIPAWILTVLVAANLIVFTYFVLLNGIYLWTTLYALTHLRRYAERVKSLDVSDILALGGAPPITILAPAYNEEATCVQAVRSLLTLQYPEYEVVVVNDGSRDRTLERLVEAYDLIPAPRAPTAALPTKRVRAVLHSRAHPNLWLIDKENGYMSCPGDGAQPEFEIALFRYHDGRPLLALCAGELEGADSTQLQFFELGADGKMHQISRPILPGTHIKNDPGMGYVKKGWQFELSRKGRTILVRSEKTKKILHKFTWNREKFQEEK